MDLSVIVPAYNEEGNTTEIHRQLTETLSKTKLTYEIIFVDDGSTDKTLKLLQKVKRKDKHTKLISFRKNLGKGAALSVGFKESSGNIIVTLDSDLQDDPAEIPKLLDKLSNGFDLVVGRKADRQDPLTKKVPSYLFNLAVSFVMGKRIHDINSGLKALKREVVDDIDVYGDLYRFIPLLAKIRGFMIGEVAVNHRRRSYGKSKYGWKRFVGGFIDLVSILFITRFRYKPAHFFSFVGFFFLFVGLIADGYVTFLKFTTGTTQGHIPLLLFGILAIIVGFQLISLGLLGELVVFSIEKDKTKRISYRTYD